MKLERLVLVLASAIGACSGGSPTTTNAPFPTAPYVTQTSEGGGYRVEVRTAPVQPPMRGNLEVEVRVSDANDAPVDGLALGVVPWMPADGHGASVVPLVSAEGDGTYRVANVDLFMPGQWQLRMTLGNNGATDRAVVAIDVQ